MTQISPSDLNNSNYCLECHKPLTGRSDQKFCNPYCRSSYHYQKNKEGENSLYLSIDKQLKRNRILLKKYNQAGKATLRKQKLLDEGFDPNYFTHYWKNTSGQVYLFCYEFGFLAFSDNKGVPKYNLIQWQAYMSSA